MKFFATLGFVLLAGTQSLATTSTPISCVNKYEILDKTMVQMVSGNGGCFLTVNPRGQTGLTYRDFLFDESGLFMIFNSFGNGAESESTGAREFYFFPRTATSLGYQYDAATQRLRVAGPHGKVFVFNTEKTILVEVSDANITVDYDVNPNNKGGIEIVQNNGLFLDLGFQRGQSPSQNPQRKITFKDSANRQCQVKNSDVFKYTHDGEVNLKYDDAQLERFLNRTCPALKF